MGCCGKSRTVASPQPAQAEPKPAPPREASFQYIGASVLTVRGPMSKRFYRFDAPGSIIAVDTRDAPSLAQVPMLRRV